VLQAREPILPGDTAETLARRILAREHAIYPLAASWYLQGRLRLAGGQATLDGQPLPPGGAQFAAAPG
jgi:phosphoribosylglycinamide formyltransferase-1